MFETNRSHDDVNLDYGLMSGVLFRYLGDSFFVIRSFDVSKLEEAIHSVKPDINVISKSYVNPSSAIKSYSDKTGILILKDRNAIVSFTYNSTILSRRVDSVDASFYELTPLQIESVRTKYEPMVIRAQKLRKFGVFQ